MFAKFRFYGKELALGLALLFFGHGSMADEGMWTFDNPPARQLAEKYGFVPTPDWLDHVRLSCVRFMDGGSGSFISPKGLVITNQHVAIGQLQKLSTAQKDWVADGFYAATAEQELKCPDLELNVLTDMTEVTTQIRATVSSAMSKEEALKARKAAIAKLEKEYHEKTGLTCNVVGLYHGGEFWVYQYKKYTDVRLVMAPERQIAYFGGDWDNFTFPRHDLDIALFRVYDNGQPLQPPHYLKWNSMGPAAEELLFVAGHPGSTNRLHTYAQLEYQRDVQYPLVLDLLAKRIAILRHYAQKGKEQERRALRFLFGMENSKKAMTGEYQGLQNKELMAKCQQQEESFRQKIGSNPEWQKNYGDCWEAISQALRLQAGSAKQQLFQPLRNSRLAGSAFTIVRYVTEIQKPDSERLDGYHDAQLERLQFYLFSPSPIYVDLDEEYLAGSLQLARDELGESDPVVKIVLQGKSPTQAAHDLVAGTKLDNAKFRKELVTGGLDAVKASDDTFIVLALALDALMREREEWYKKNIESVLSPAAEKIAQARFAVYGKATYPDATFSLRLAYGLAKGYPTNGTQTPYKTTLYGLYDRSLAFDGKGDYSLPQRFWDRRDRLDLSIPANFVSTCDIIGGNSGSPVINRNGEIVGVIFDGNIESLSGRFVYEDTKNRAVAVHSAFVIEALRKLYDAGALADEIEGK